MSLETRTQPYATLRHTTQPIRYAYKNRRKGYAGRTGPKHDGTARPACGPRNWMRDTREGNAIRTTLAQTLNATYSNRRSNRLLPRERRENSRRIWATERRDSGARVAFCLTPDNSEQFQRLTAPRSCGEKFLCLSRGDRGGTVALSAAPWRPSRRARLRRKSRTTRSRSSRPATSRRSATPPRRSG